MELEAVHPDLRDAAAKMAPFEIDLASLSSARQQLNDNLASADGAANSDIVVRQISALSRAGHEVPLLIYEPATATRRGALLDIHGGGFIFGQAAMNDSASRRIVSELAVVVVSVDYRLAPEHPFPAGLEDCRTAARWLMDHRRELGVEGLPLLILGNSAGGGLAAGLCLSMRDRGQETFDGLVLLSPMLDDRTSDGTLPPFAGCVGWSSKDNGLGWTALLGESPGGENISEYAAPARAKSLDAMPPTFLSVGSIDLFCEETATFARRLIAAGVPTELHIYRGAFHGFARFAPDAAISRRSVADYLAAINTLLNA